jgi:hypothetical protein
MNSGLSALPSTDFVISQDSQQPLGTGIREIKKMYNRYQNKKNKKELKERALELQRKVKEKQMRLIEKQKNSKAGSTHRGS